MPHNQPEARTELDFFTGESATEKQRAGDSERPISDNAVGDTFRRQIVAVTQLAVIAANRGQRVIADADEFVESPSRDGRGYQILMRLNACLALLDMFDEFRWRIYIDLDKHNYSRYNAFDKRHTAFIAQTQRQIRQVGDDIAVMFGQQFCRFNCAEESQHRKQNR